MREKLNLRARVRTAIVQAIALAVAGVVVVAPRPAEASTLITTSYAYTGATQTFTVPAGVTSLTVTLKGGQGGRGGGDSQGSPTPGGYQGVVTGVIAVTPGDVITVAVGGGGGTGVSSQGSAPGGSAGLNPLPGYDGAVGGIAGPQGSSGGGGGSGAATALVVGSTTIVAGGAGGNGGNGQYLPIVGRRAEETHTPRADDPTSTTGRPGMNTSLACSPGFNCDGGASGAGGGGAAGGERGAVQYGGATATEYFGFGGYPGANSTTGLSGLFASYDYYAGNSANGSISISYDDGAPGAPLSLAGTAGTNEVALTWSPPSSSGSSAITDYVVEYGTSASGPFTTFDDGVSTTTAAEVTGLINGTDFYFRVTAINGEGPGASATTSIAIVPSDVPSAPTVTGLTAFGSGIYVDFTPGASDAPITGYEYRLDGGTWTAGSVAANRMTISGLTNGQSYSVEIRELNSIGASTASSPAQSATPIDVPQAPTPLLATAHAGSIDASWTAPSVVNGSAVTDYVIQTATSLGGPYTTFADGTSTAVATTITGLTNGTTYYVRVAAANGAGTGAWSTTAVATPFTTPSAPSIAVAAGDGTLSVDITPGFDGGSAVTAYQYRLGAGGTWKSTGSLATTFAIPGLTNATSYDVYVRAVNAAGIGPASSPVTGTPRTVPAAPTIAAVALDTGAVSVSFTVGSDGGSALTNVEYSIDGGSNWITRSPASTASPLPIGGLVGGETYPISLRLVNAVGASLPSNTSSVTAKGTPEAPSITVTPGNGSLVVVFTPPANGGSPILNYEYSTDSGSTWITRSPASTASPLSIGALDNGTAYSVRLRAVNAAGSGASSPVVAGTPRTVPGPPTIDSDTVVGIFGEIQVEFTAPTSDGGSAITGYQYTTDGGVTWRDCQTGTTESPLQILALSSDGTTALTGGEVYPVEIRAVNAAGPGLASAVAAGITTTVPDAPVIDTVDSGDGSATVHFTPGANGGSAIVGYEYRLDGGSWIDTGSLSDSFIVSGLTNSLTDSLELRAVNGVGNSAPSDSVAVQVFTTPGPPALGEIVAGDQTLLAAFTAGDDGGSAITGYEYSTDGGVTWRTRSTGTTSSPLAILAESGSGAALTNGVVYAVQLRAVNAAGAGEASETSLVAPQGAPSAPTSFTVSGGDSSLVLTFAPGDDGGSAITAYEYQLDGGSWIDAGSLSSPITIVGLDNGSVYSVVVRARNAVGAGDPSAPQNGTPRTVPDAPTGVLSTSASHEITVSWTAPAYDGGAAITGYTVTLYDQATGGSSVDTCTSTVLLTCTVTGLTNGSTLYADVVAQNAAGAGPASEPRFAQTPLAAPLVEIASIAPSSTSLSIAVDVVDSGGSPITAYQYQLDGGSWQTAATASSPFTISSLTTGVSYSIRIRAVNGAGAGDPSAPVTGVPHTAPGIPTALSATSAPASAVLSWTAPASNGGQPVTDYVVQYATSSSGPFTTFDDGTSSSATATVTGLTNATTYFFRVAAVNTAGQGAWSSLASTTALGMPSAPTITAITPGSSYLQVAFTTPSSNGGSAVTGYEYQLDGGAWHTTSATSSPMTITGLTNGQTYGVKIRAVNAVGAGTASASVSAKPYGLPAGVVGFRSSPGSGSVTLDWDAVNDNGSPITAYNLIRWSAASEGSIVSSYQTTATSYTVSSLSNGTYYFTIEATNAAGTGPRSAPRTTAIVGSTLPSAPSALSVSVVGGVASLTWIAGSAGSSAIASYLVQYSADGSSWTTMSSGSSSTSSAFPVPSPTTPYSLRVAAISAAGVGAFVTVAPPLVATGVASVSGTSEATIGGSVNANAGSAEVTFEYATDAADLGTISATIVAGSPSPVTGTDDEPVTASLTGLDPGTTYVVRAIATSPDAVAYGSVVTFTTDGSIVSSNLDQTYSGSPVTIDTVTVPADLAIERTYEGVGDTVYTNTSTPPTATGTYQITTTSTDATIGGQEVALLTISPKAIIVTVSAANREYDGTTAATLTLGLDGAVDGDDVSANASAISGSFADASVGVGKVVNITVTGSPLTGPDAGNYEATVPTTTTATISGVAPDVAQSLDLSIERVPGEQIADSLVHVIAEGLKPNSIVRIELHSDIVLLGTGTTNGSGTLDINVTMPQVVSPGVHHLVAVGTGADGNPVAKSVEIFIDWSGSLVEPAGSGGGYTSTKATRILDTRENGKSIPAMTEHRLAVPAGLAPADVTGVVLNLTVTDASGGGFVTVYPCGATRPLAAAINFTAGETKANLVDVRLAGGDEVCLWSNASTHVVVDFQGYFSESGVNRLVSRTAVRLVDTRPSDALVERQALAIPVIGSGKAPAGTTTVALNVAVDDPQNAGFLTVYPCGTTRPWASNLNFVAGQTVSNEVLVAPGSSGQVCVYTTSPTQLVVDLDATFQPGGAGAFTAVVAGRLADTRLATKLVAGQTVEWNVAGDEGGEMAVSLNVAATEPEHAGFLTVYPCGTDRPWASNLNFAAGQTISNHVTVAVGDNGKLCVFASVTTHVVVDVEGIYRAVS